MSELPEIKKDDWIVIDDQFTLLSHHYIACRVIKVTPAKVVAADGPRSNARHFYRDKVLLIGAEGPAKRVVEQLTSSAALMAEEHQNSRRRHLGRVEKIVRKAGG